MGTLPFQMIERKEMPQLIKKAEEQRNLEGNYAGIHIETHQICREWLSNGSNLHDTS
jgi:hypothetical protein